jgi:feruloyl esterase
MAYSHSIAASLGIALFFVCAISDAATPERCATLSSVDFSGLPNAPTQIVSAKAVAASAERAQHCLIEGYVAPQVGFAIRLPMEGWNGKFLMQGCGGFCGSLFIDLLDDGLARGYAVATSDMGHRAPGLEAKWAYNNREAELDFGFRATHVTAIAAKAITTAFYDAQPRYSYFRGCSLGGRQGLQQATQFPADFDGIIAGAPFVSETRRALRMAWTSRVMLDDTGKAIVDGDKIPMLHQAAIAACDGLDGVKDGVIDDPQSCAFDPASLQCGRSGGRNCLSPAEVKALQRVYEGPRSSTGEALAPGGWFPGSEKDWHNYIRDYAYTNSRGIRLVGAYARVAEDYLRYLVFFDDPGPTYDLLQFDFDRDPAKLQLMSAILDVTSTDMAAFRERGGKLLMYQGWSDPSVSPRDTIDYFTRLQTSLGGAESAGATARLFMMPGMGHCSGGAGADRFDYLAALEQWVEQGQAPEVLIGHHLADTPAYLSVKTFPIPADEIAFTRPVFPFPDRAVYDGLGDPKAATSYRRMSLGGAEAR